MAGGAVVGFPGGPGLPIPAFFWIQSINIDTLAYTPYFSLRAQPCPQLVTPCR